MERPSLLAPIWRRSRSPCRSSIFPESGSAIGVLINSNTSMAWHGMFHIERELIKKQRNYSAFDSRLQLFPQPLRNKK